MPKNSANKATTKVTPDFAEGGANYLPKIPTEIEGLFNQRPLILGESPKDYDGLMHMHMRLYWPEDVREWILIKEVIDNTWEVFRLNRLKANFLLAQRHQKFDIVSDIIPFDEKKMRDALDKAWLALQNGDEEGMERANAVLQRRHQNLDTVMAEALALFMREYGILSSMSLAASKRRDQLLQDLENYRASAATAIEVG